MEFKSIPMEAETIPMLIAGFVVVVILVCICIIGMIIKSKNKSFIWFLFQLVFLSLGFKFSLDVLDNTVDTNLMLSEHTSLSIGLSALLWAISMFCMVIGIWQVSKKIIEKTNNKYF